MEAEKIYRARIQMPASVCFDLYFDVDHPTDEQVQEAVDERLDLLTEGWDESLLPDGRVYPGEIKEACIANMEEAEMVPDDESVIRTKPEDDEDEQEQ